MGDMDEGIGWNWLSGEEGAAAIGCLQEIEIRRGQEAYCWRVHDRLRTMAELWLVNRGRIRYPKGSLFPRGIFSAPWIHYIASRGIRIAPGTTNVKGNEMKIR
jgi:hypothetical protein